jgi:AraC-like DNA-binding protein
METSSSAAHFTHDSRTDGGEPSNSPVETQFEIELTPVEKLLKRTPLVGVGLYRCPISNPQFGGGGPERCPYIVFSRSSVRLETDHSAPEACTPNTVNLWNVGDSYIRKPISAEGVICDYIAFAPALLRETAVDVDPGMGDLARVFERPIAPIGSNIYIAQRAFFEAVRENPALPDMVIEEAAVRLLQAVLLETKTKSSQKESKRRNSQVSEARIRTAVEGAKAILSHEYLLNISISELAARVHCSPGHLSREFKRLSGFTLHGYQQHLRVRASLQMLCDSRFNGAAIASQLGFATHSHFSDVFRKYFGMTPKQFVNKASVESLAKLDAMLEARSFRVGPIRS